MQPFNPLNDDEKVEPFMSTPTPSNPLQIDFSHSSATFQPNPLYRQFRLGRRDSNSLRLSNVERHYHSPFPDAQVDPELAAISLPEVEEGLTVPTIAIKHFDDEYSNEIEDKTPVLADINSPPPKIKVLEHISTNSSTVTTPTMSTITVTHKNYFTTDSFSSGTGVILLNSPPLPTPSSGPSSTLQTAPSSISESPLLDSTPSSSTPPSPTPRLATIKSPIPLSREHEIASSTLGTGSIKFSNSVRITSGVKHRGRKKRKMLEEGMFVPERSEAVTGLSLQVGEGGFRKGGGSSTRRRRGRRTVSRGKPKSILIVGSRDSRSEQKPEGGGVENDTKTPKSTSLVMASETPSLPATSHPNSDSNSPFPRPHMNRLYSSNSLEFAPSESGTGQTPSIFSSTEPSRASSPSQASSLRVPLRGSNIAPTKPFFGGTKKKNRTYSGGSIESASLSVTGRRASANSWMSANTDYKGKGKEVDDDSDFEIIYGNGNGVIEEEPTSDEKFTNYHDLVWAKEMERIRRKNEEFIRRIRSDGEGSRYMRSSGQVLFGDEDEAGKVEGSSRRPSNVSDVLSEGESLSPQRPLLRSSIKYYEPRARSLRTSENLSPEESPSRRKKSSEKIPQTYNPDEDQSLGGILLDLMRSCWVSCLGFCEDFGDEDDEDEEDEEGVKGRLRQSLANRETQMLMGESSRSGSRRNYQAIQS